MNFDDNIERIEVRPPAIGQQYDLEVRKHLGQPVNPPDHPPHLILDCTYMYYQNNGPVGAFVFRYKHPYRRSGFEDWPMEDNPNNHIYKRATIGDIVSVRNPNKKQSITALRAVNHLPDDMKKLISKYGGNKKRTRNRKTLKNKKNNKKKQKIKKSKKKKTRNNLG